MARDPHQRRIRPGWWTAILLVVVVVMVGMSWALFNRSFSPYVRVTLTADRAGLIMESGSKVKFRGVDVGHVGDITGGRQPVSLQLDIDPDEIRFIPANVEARIRATTAFGAKYVDLTYPEKPDSKRLFAGAVLKSSNVSTEVNTVLENLVGVLRQIDPAKLNAVLTAVAEGLRGQGQRIGEAVTDADHVLRAVNPRSETVRQDLRSVKAFSDTYAAAAQDILATLDAASTTSATLTSHAKDLDALLLNAVGLGQTGIDVVGPNEDNLIRAVNILEPTTNLLMKYAPEYTCLLTGSKYFLDNGGYANAGGNGFSLMTDTALLLGNDPYVYPDNLPLVAAKGGPGGKPGCGSLPVASNDFPVRMLVTNTGWGTGMDIRDNSGLGHPCYENFFPVTRAVPEQPSVRCQGPPSPGLVIPPQGPLPLPPADSVVTQAPPP